METKREKTTSQTSSEETPKGSEGPRSCPVCGSEDPNFNHSVRGSFYLAGYERGERETLDKLSQKEFSKLFHFNGVWLVSNPREGWVRPMENEADYNQGDYLIHVTSSISGINTRILIADE